MLSVLTQQNLCGCILLVRGGFLAWSTNFQKKKDNKHKVNMELKTVTDNKTALWHRKLKRALRPLSHRAMRTTTRYSSILAV